MHGSEMRDSSKIAVPMEMWTEKGLQGFLAWAHNHSHGCIGSDALKGLCEGDTDGGELWELAVYYEMPELKDALLEALDSHTICGAAEYGVYTENEELKRACKCVADRIRLCEISRDGLRGVSAEAIDLVIDQHAERKGLEGFRLIRRWYRVHARGVDEDGLTFIRAKAAWLARHVDVTRISTYDLQNTVHDSLLFEPGAVCAVLLERLRGGSGWGRHALFHLEREHKIAANIVAGPDSVLIRGAGLLGVDRLQRTVGRTADPTSLGAAVRQQPVAERSELGMTLPSAIVACEIEECSGEALETESRTMERAKLERAQTNRPSHNRQADDSSLERVTRESRLLPRQSSQKSTVRQPPMEINTLESQMLDKPGQIGVFSDGGFCFVHAFTGRVVVYSKDGVCECDDIRGWGLPEALLKRPWALAVPRDQDTIFVTDNQQDCVAVLTRDGELLYSFGSAILSAPTGICVDGCGNVFVCDAGHSRVLMFGDYGHSKKGLHGFGCHSKGVGPFRILSSIAVSPTDACLLVTDFNRREGVGRVLLMDYKGDVICVIGRGVSRFPCGIGFSCGGDIVVSDPKNRCMCVYDCEGTLLQEFGRDECSEPSNPHSNDAKHALSNHAIAVRGGSILVTDYATSCVQVYTPIVHGRRTETVRTGTMMSAAEGMQDYGGSSPVDMD